MKQNKAKRKRKPANAGPVDKAVVDRWKADWRRAGLRTDQVNFLAELQLSNLLIEAFRGSTKERAQADWHTASRGANRMHLELNASHPGLVAGVIERNNQVARQKTDLVANALLDVEEEDARLAAVNFNARRFAGADAQPEPEDRDVRPIVAGTVSLGAQIQALLAE